MKRLLFVIILSFIISCGEFDNSDKKLNQETIDRYTGYAIIDAISQLYNINFAGRPVGSHNLKTKCPDGGEVTITGSTGYSSNNGITTVDLSFQMIDCQTSKHTNDNVDITLKLSGNISFKGSFNNNTNYNATNHQSESLKILCSIKVPDYDAEDIDKTCKFTATVTNTTVSGYICDRKFSY